jgi:hypothetical protein
MEYIAFYACLPLDQLDYLEETLTQYKIELYLITHEVSNSSHKLTDGSHFHFVVQMSKPDYDAYVKKVFRLKYNLQGQARNGIGKQYGRVKDIRSVELMKSYCLKDNGTFRTNLSEAEIKELKSKSYVKEIKKDRDMKEELMKHLGEKIYSCEFEDKQFGRKTREIDTMKLRMVLIVFFRNHPTYRPHLNRSMIDRYINYFLLYYYKDITDENLY